MATGQFTCYQLFEHETSSLTYVLADDATQSALIIDPVLETVARDLQLLRELELDLRHILETHLHSDHITGAAPLPAATGARVAVVRARRIRGAYAYSADGTSWFLEAAGIACMTTPGH